LELNTHARYRLIAVLIPALATLAVTAEAQRSGQSIQVQYGVVVSSSYVQEASNAPAGALIGGAIGLYTGKGKSSGTKFRRSTAGAIAGGATASAVQGSREARQYEVKTQSGTVVIISDQTQIEVDDCVIVENPGTTNANIRRVAPTFCDPASAEVVAELGEEIQEEAEECAAAKRELADAADDASFDRAMRKIEILCNM
jgi:outer membrane lipoprotein SlyB